LAGAVLSALLVVAPGVPAQAKPSVSDIEKQIDAANNKLEPLINEYDRVHSQLQTDRAKATALEAKLMPLQLRVDIALAQLGPIAAHAYEAGPSSTFALLANAGSTANLLDQMTILDQIARQRQEKIASVMTLRDSYAAQKKALDATLAKVAAQNADLTARTKTIETQIAALQKLRQQIYGTSGAVGVLRPVACPFTYISGAAGIAVRAACKQIGKPYIWAAAGPGSFDCSGLTLYAWAQAGVTLRHYTVWQWDDTRPVTRAQLQPGDLVFFFPPSLHHMGIYVGGGWMVHAPHTGDYVRMARIDSLPIAGYRRP
jgi:cell wall-associated NlpC family hydrolase